MTPKNDTLSSGIGIAPDLSFGVLLARHLLRGARPLNSTAQGKKWGKKEFADAVGVSDRQVRFWLSNKSRPAEIDTIERLLFGENQQHYAEQRLELRRAHERARSGASRSGREESVEPKAAALTNVPIRVPEHFLGRENALGAINTSLGRFQGRVVITALHGLRGVGKTTLAAAYAERYREYYRVTWWIRAQTEATMRADLVGLGVRLGWIAADEKEEPALVVVMERLSSEGKGLLLIYDNAIDAEGLRPYLPRSGGANILVTSNAPNWRSVAQPVQIEIWPEETGADYLIARTNRAAEREEALVLSGTLGGLPLAHEQAAAYCERLDASLAAYHQRFEKTPVKYLDDIRHAPSEYGLTVAKTFALAIDQAAKLHPAAELLIVYAALLAPEPIPLFLFSDAREKFGEPLSSALDRDGLMEAIAALRAFALIDREMIADERDPSIVTDCVRLHRLVRQVAAARSGGGVRERMRQNLVDALAAVYPQLVWRDPKTWPRARRLDAISMALVGGGGDLPNEVEEQASSLLLNVGLFRQYALATYADARPVFERALSICEKSLGPEHPSTATSLNNLARLLFDQDDLATAQPLFERALAIREKVLGPKHPETATSLNNLALLRENLGDLKGAQPLYERTLVILETAAEFGPKHPSTAASLNNIGHLLQAQGDLQGARPLLERALAILEEVLGSDHPNTNRVRGNLATLLLACGEPAKALPLADAALAALDKVLGPTHPGTKNSAQITAEVLAALDRTNDAKILREKYKFATTK